MCTWDLVDGKCRESVKLAYVHTSMQPYQMNSCEDIRLFCNGCYAEVSVVSLEKVVSAAIFFFTGGPKRKVIFVLRVCFFYLFFSFCSIGSFY